MDVRDYKGAIRDAVKRERDNDENWSWRVLAINKGEARFAWGYLADYLGDKSPFVVRVIDDDDFGIAVEAVSPDGHKAVRFVGPSRWDDFKSVDDGIASAIHGIARYAKSAY